MGVVTALDLANIDDERPMVSYNLTGYDINRPGLINEKTNLFTSQKYIVSIPPWLETSNYDYDTISYHCNYDIRKKWINQSQDL